MTKPFENVLFVIFLIGIPMVVAMNAFGAPKVGERLPEFELQVPENPEEREYLGVTGDGSFKIPQIKAEIVIIEIFSMYCPHCQREAPTMNDFYNRIEASDKFRGKVKIIGIGVGNSTFEVDFFRKQYQVPFPLFEDGDFVIHKLLGEVRTPYFLGVAIEADGNHRLFYAKLGGAKDAGALLEEMLALTALK